MIFQNSMIIMFHVNLQGYIYITLPSIHCMWTWLWTARTGLCQRPDEIPHCNERFFKKIVLFNVDILKKQPSSHTKKSDMSKKIKPIWHSTILVGFSGDPYNSRVWNNSYKTGCHKFIPHIIRFWAVFCSAPWSRLLLSLSLWRDECNLLSLAAVFHDFFFFRDLVLLKVLGIWIWN